MTDQQDSVHVYQTLLAGPVVHAHLFITTIPHVYPVTVIQLVPLIAVVILLLVSALVKEMCSEEGVILVDRSNMAFLIACKYTIYGHL